MPRPRKGENSMAKQKYTEAKKNSNLKWDTANLDRMSLAFPKGSRETIKAHAAAQGESTNAFIKRAIDCQMERDGGGSVAKHGGSTEGPQEVAGAAAVAGGIFLPLDALEAAQQAAGRTGEAVGDFLARAVQAQAKRDEISLHTGVNPATGGKLDSKGGADHE